MDQHGNLNKFHPKMSSNQKQKRRMNHSPNENPKMTQNKNDTAKALIPSKLSKPQLNHNSTQHNITLSWVRHENDFAHHPTPPPQKLNVSNILAVNDLILMKL